MMKYRQRTGSKVVTVSMTMSLPHYSALQRYAAEKKNGGFGVHVEKALERNPKYRELLDEERRAEEHANYQTKGGAQARSHNDITKDNIIRDITVRRG